MAFPISSVNERVFEPDWSGEVFVCDIDRTYLHTRFSTLQGLAQIPFEFAVDKKEIEGMVPLLLEVRRGPGARSRQTPLYFISASPSQLRPVIQRKMLLDGLEFDGTVFKDWLGVLASLRLKRLKEQVGFKLTALLLHRKELPRGARQILIGDDLESDALTFALFADAMAGRLDQEQLLAILLQQGVADDDARGICRLVAELPRTEAVKRAYIRMERHGSAEALIDFWPHVALCRGAFQMALGLWQAGSISESGVLRVAADLRAQGHPAQEVAIRLAESCRRGLVERERCAELQSRLMDHGLLDAIEELPGIEPEWESTSVPGKPWTPRRPKAGSA